MEKTVTTVCGVASGMWRYPVKSMLGEELASVEVSSRGLAGDRVFALIDNSTGKVASAKNPRKWATLLNCRAKLNLPTSNGVPAVQITLPNGDVFDSGQPDCNEILSGWLERPVTLSPSNPQREGSLEYEIYWPEVEGLGQPNSVTTSPVSWGAEAGTYYNFAPVHLITTASLRKLQALLPDSAVVLQRFRPNILIDTGPDTVDFVENEWIGKTLEIGPEIKLQVTVGCPRCVLPTLSQENAKVGKDEKILRGIVQHNRIDLGQYGKQACFGVYANVIREGTLRKGDTVRVEGQ